MKLVGNQEFRNIEFTRVSDTDKYGTVYTQDGEELTGLIVKEVHNIDSDTYTQEVRQDIYALELEDGENRVYLVVNIWAEAGRSAANAIVRKHEISKYIKEILI